MPALGDIHKRSLISPNASGSVPDKRGGVQAGNSHAVAAAKRYFAPVDCAALQKRFLFLRPLFGVKEEIGKRVVQQLITAVVAQHVRQRRVYILKFAVGSGEINALLQRLKKFGEACFIFALPGDVAGQGADPLLGAIANQNLQRTLQEPRGSIVFQPDAQHAGPVTLFKKPRQSFFRGSPARAFGYINEIIQRFTNQLGKGVPKQIGHGAIGGNNFAIQGDREQQILEGIDEVAISALRVFHHLEQFFKLPKAGRCGSALLETANHSA